MDVTEHCLEWTTKDDFPHCTTTTVSERNFLPALICQDEKVYIEKSYGKDWIP
jgi:hypothetical protein